jgi:hypothetical protein
VSALCRGKGVQGERLLGVWGCPPVTSLSPTLSQEKGVQGRSPAGGLGVSPNCSLIIYSPSPLEGERGPGVRGYNTNPNEEQKNPLCP